jgi:hypothetical protein
MPETAIRFARQGLAAAGFSWSDERLPSLVPSTAEEFERIQRMVNEPMVERGEADLKRMAAGNLLVGGKASALHLTQTSLANKNLLFCLGTYLLRNFLYPTIGRAVPSHQSGSLAGDVFRSLSSDVGCCLRAFVQGCASFHTPFYSAEAVLTTKRLDSRSPALHDAQV